MDEHPGSWAQFETSFGYGDDKRGDGAVFDVISQLGRGVLVPDTIGASLGFATKASLAIAPSGSI